MTFWIIFLQVFFEILDVRVDYLSRNIVMYCFICCTIFKSLSLFTKSKITKLDMPMLVYQYVIRFEISMDVIFFMYALDCQDLCYEKVTI